VNITHAESVDAPLCLRVTKAMLRTGWSMVDCLESMSKRLLKNGVGMWRMDSGCRTME